MSLITTLKKYVTRWIGDESGMTLPLMAMSMIVITGLTGVAIDTARAQLVQSKLQFSLDSAGLAGGSTVSTAQLNSEVTKYLNTNFNGYLGAIITSSSASVDSTNTIITLSASARVSTAFMGLFGINDINLSANSEISRAVTGLELVLVLDNTGSMNNSAGAGVTKIQALQSASTTLINSLFASNPQAGKLWVGIVPFSQAVNVGTAHTDWLDTAYDTGLNWRTTSWGGCLDARSNGLDVTDDPPSAGSINTLFRQYYWGSDNNNCWAYTQTGSGRHRVTSCLSSGATVGSPLDTSNQGPNLYCSQEVTNMTNVKSTLTSAVSTMVAQGNTVINQGLQWGWNMLSPNWQGKWGGTMNANGLPLNYGTKGMAKAIVLLTDGENTIDNGSHGSYWYLQDNKLGTTGSSAAVTELNNRTLQLCTAMKNKGIYIYAIALGTDVTTASLSMLQSCATAQNYFFNSPSTTQLQGIFNQIGDSLSSLRVSK
jgi:hypothetical protein